ncbi:hypothetical protein N657DRAFT_76306 [Parathielavia appendiculata]|uniref:Uncharacterized protein n=1 Tax=Parathielavia appendiculata TaxID=2587402 RepID=A0AAN6UAJ2_9PEZI|nr:hypothetical protein N657DRAFT_76306 [Parathielavia appendiculata]
MKRRAPDIVCWRQYIHRRHLWTLSIAFLLGSSQIEMDVRGYGLPIHSDDSAYPGVHSNQRDQYSGKRVNSLCDLSLSDGEYPRDMPPWTPFPKKSRQPETKYHDFRKPLETLSRNQNPGIDIALRNMNYEVGASLKTFRALVQCFEAEIEPLRDWAEERTLNTIWRNRSRTSAAINETRRGLRA